MTLMPAGKYSPDALQVAEEETVGQAQGRALLQRGKHLLVVLHLGRVGDQEENHVGLGNDRVHFAQGIVLFGEPGLPGCLQGRPAGPQADLDPDIGAGQRIAQVLCLGRALGAPADDPDLTDPLKGPGEQGKLVAAAADDGFPGLAELNCFGCKYFGCKLGFHQSPPVQFKKTPSAMD